MKGGSYGGKKSHTPGLQIRCLVDVVVYGSVSGHDGCAQPAFAGIHHLSVDVDIMRRRRFSAVHSACLVGDRFMIMSHSPVGGVLC